MAHCSKCGAQAADDAAFCSRCGQPLSGAAPLADAPSGLAENVAGLLCYVGGWITGLIFFLIDKRPFVRFHAAQSMVVFGGLHIISLVFWGGGTMRGWPSYAMGFAGWGFYGLWNLIGLVLWILLMVKAYQKEEYRIPIAAGIAESLSKK